MTKKTTIFVVEDEEILANTLREYLQDRGYLVEVAHNGAEAIKMLPTVRPNMILLDIVLPEVNGVTFLKEIQKPGSEFKDTPVLVLTNLPGDLDSFRGMGVNADGYFVKANTKLEELEKNVKAILAK